MLVLPCPALDENSGPVVAVVDLGRGEVVAEVPAVDPLSALAATQDMVFGGGSRGSMASWDLRQSGRALPTLRIAHAGRLGGGLVACSELACAPPGGAPIVAAAGYALDMGGS